MARIKYSAKKNLYFYEGYSIDSPGKAKKFKRLLDEKERLEKRIDAIKHMMKGLTI